MLHEEVKPAGKGWDQGRGSSASKRIFPFCLQDDYSEPNFKSLTTKQVILFYTDTVAYFLWCFIYWISVTCGIPVSPYVWCVKNWQARLLGKMNWILDKSILFLVGKMRFKMTSLSTFRDFDFSVSGCGWDVPKWQLTLKPRGLWDPNKNLQ